MNIFITHSLLNLSCLLVIIAVCSESVPNSHVLHFCSISQKGQFNLKSEKDNSRGPISEMDSVLSLDDGRWSQPSVNVTSENLFQLNIRQPSPPPVMARVQPQQRVNSIPPLHVADPQPGPPKLMNGEAPDSKTFKNLHIVRSFFSQM